MKKTRAQRTLLATGLLILATTSLQAEEVNLEVSSLKIPSLDLLLYLGEFQDRDGSLLEPEFFDDSLKLTENEKNTETENNHEQHISKIKLEDDNEKGQP